MVTYRKQKTKEYIKFLAQKVVTVALEIKVVVTYERVLKQCLTEKQKDIICEVVAYRRWSLMGGGRLRQVVAMRELTVLICYQP